MFACSLKLIYKQTSALSKRILAFQRPLSSLRLDFGTFEKLKNDSGLCQKFMDSAKCVVLCDRKYHVKQNLEQKGYELAITATNQIGTQNIIRSVLLSATVDSALFGVSVKDVSAFSQKTHQLIEPRPALFLLPREQLDLATMSLNLLQWQVDNKFCSKCTLELKYHVSGRSCRCDQCDLTYFPRYSPVVIMLVVSNDYCLLGRNRQFPSRMFSALAGFIDVGENIEQAVVREVSEEVNIDVDISSVKYITSDFWGGFRRNYSPELMIGCVVSVSTTQDPVCSEEIAEAKWFHKDEIRDALEKSKLPGTYLEGEGVMVPPPFATAHQLMALWCRN